MLKHKSSSFILISILASLVILLAACKSLPAGRTVDPIELLDNKSGFYIAIPKAADTVLIERMISNNVQNISGSDVKLLSDRINKIYCGLNRSRKNLEMQASIDSSIPTGHISKVLNKKNGWEKSTFTPESGGNQYPVYSYDGMDLAFPTKSITCIGRNMDYMINRYDNLSAMPAESADNPQLYSDLPQELVEYLKGAEDEIRFYANKPQSFLTILTGANLDLRLIDVKGSFVTDPKHESQYLLNLDFNFKSDKYMRAGKALLTLAFGLTNSQSLELSTNELQINGIKIDKQQLYKILVL